MTRGAASLLLAVQSTLPAGASGVMLGLSGGRDSAALLALLASGARALPLRAVHIDHGLQAAAVEFRSACTALCRRFDVPLDIIDVSVSTGGNVSVEAAARSVRYAAFRRALRPGECLLTAHHCDDQAETLMLQLLRGAGLKGLAAMPACREFGRGWHVRPVLELSRDALVEIAQEFGVEAVADPMNADARYDRAYLRAAVWPALEARWPGAARTLARSAAHAASAHASLSESAAASWRRVRDGNELSITGLRALPSAERLNVARYWLAANGVELPSTLRLSESLRQMLNARPEQSPSIVWGESALRRYRDRVFLTAAALPTLDRVLPMSLARETRVALGEGLGELAWRTCRGGLDLTRLPQQLELRPRQGGEILKPGPRARTQSLQHLCQVRGILPWMRQAIPLVFAERQLIAVGDLWTDARWCVGPEQLGVSVAWAGAPNLV